MCEKHDHHDRAPEPELKKAQHNANTLSSDEYEAWQRNWERREAAAAIKAAEVDAEARDEAESQAIMKAIAEDVALFRGFPPSQGPPGA